MILYPLGPDTTTARGFSVVTGGIFDRTRILILNKKSKYEGDALKRR